MNILIATPLYPPDTGETAQYVQELARRCTDTHSVTLLAYAQVPEGIPNVQIIAVSKRLPLLLRTLRYTIALWREVYRHNIIVSLNGSSVELPLVLVSFFTHTQYILNRADSNARERASQSLPLRIISSLARWRAATVIDDIPLPKPEILPFTQTPNTDFTTYEQSWKAHRAALERLLTTYAH